MTNTDLSGNRAPYVPEKTLMIAAQYKSPAGYFFRSEWNWNDKTYYDDANLNTFKEDDYSFLNTRIGYQTKHFSLYLFGDNLTDNKYYSFILPSFNAGTPAKPRTFGIRAGLKF